MSKSIKDLTKTTNWVIPYEKPTDADLQTSCLMRIADATELMATNYRQLQDERDRYKRWYEEQGDYLRRSDRRLSAARGQTTKARKEIERLRAVIQEIG